MYVFFSFFFFFVSPYSWKIHVLAESFLFFSKVEINRQTFVCITMRFICVSDSILYLHGDYLDRNAGRRRPQVCSSFFLSLSLKPTLKKDSIIICS